MAHKFKIGQFVELEPSLLRSLAKGPYEIRHLTPSSDRHPNDPIYRIKSTAEKHERVAPESELTLRSVSSPDPIGSIQKCFLDQR